MCVFGCFVSDAMLVERKIDFGVQRGYRILRSYMVDRNVDGNEMEILYSVVIKPSRKLVTFDNNKVKMYRSDFEQMVFELLVMFTMLYF